MPSSIGSVAALAGRILIAYFFVSAGIAKLVDLPGAIAYTASGGIPGGLAIPAMLLEIGGGLAVLVGWQTRIAAFALAVFTLVAGLFFHYLPSLTAEPGQAFVQSLMFNKNLAIAGGLFVIAGIGAGALSLDARRGGRAALA